MMTRDFCYWLQGFFEINGTNVVTPQQIDIIKNHLNLCFEHDIDNQYPEKKKTELMDVHDGAKPKNRVKIKQDTQRNMKDFRIGC
jgi:hypothetical protein